jgi:regulator of sirC expression with transglutaminase-like and TPR domain
LLRGIEGNHALLSDADLLEANNEAHYLRLLQVLKAALIRDEHFSYALRCIDLILELEPDEPYEIRDRGFLLQQLDCKKLASEDFSYFIEQCPDDPITRVLKAQVEELAVADDTVH